MDSLTAPTRRSFLKTTALAATGLGLLYSDLLRVPAVAAEGKEVAGVKLDDLPLLGPYLLPTETPFESIRVAFRGTEEKTRGAAGVLSYGLKTAGEKEVAFNATDKHVLELKDLAADAEYQYVLQLGDYKSPVYRFRTSPKPGARAQKTKLGLFFDFHCHAPKEVEQNEKGAENFFKHYGYAMADIKKFAPDMLILGGDIVDEGIRREEYDTFFRIMRDVCANAIAVPIPGNHEWGTDKDLSIYADYWPMPQNGPEGDKNNTWSFAYGGIGWQMRKNGSGDWLKANIRDLKEKRGADTIVDVQHYQVYQWAEKSTDLGKKGVCDVFDAEGGVRLCLFGHRHIHQRSLPLLYEGNGKATTKEKSEYAPDTKGTIYMQSPSMWYQYTQPLENPLVACNGKPSFAGSYTGYGEMTITPEALVSETYVYDGSGKSRHDRIDQFKLLRSKG
ncbi:MAG: metallophosphoesterase [Planctomycetes bacterium]|nr:metallophosphoesterase [Planctomycetota bacterium]